jgi:hypothetical protein
MSRDPKEELDQILLLLAEPIEKEKLPPSG